MLRIWIPGIIPGAQGALVAVPKDCVTRTERRRILPDQRAVRGVTRSAEPRCGEKMTVSQETLVAAPWGCGTFPERAGRARTQTLYIRAVGFPLRLGDFT